MSVILDPALYVIKLQLTLADDLKQLPRHHGFELTLSKSHWQRAHFAPNIQLFNAQSYSLKRYDFVAVSCPLDKIMNGCEFHPDN